jgi:hypothetical protein
MAGAVFSAARVARVAVDDATLNTIVGLLKIPNKRDRDQILKGGVFIVAAASSGAPSSGARASRTSARSAAGTNRPARRQK